MAMVAMVAMVMEVLVVVVVIVIVSPGCLGGRGDVKSSAVCNSAV